VPLKQLPQIEKEKASQHYIVVKYLSDLSLISSKTQSQNIDVGAIDVVISDLKENIRQLRWCPSNLYLIFDFQDDTLMLETSPTRTLVERDQVIDYSCRGEQLANYNVMQFFMETYKQYKTSADSITFTETPSKHSHSWPQNIQIGYTSEHPKHSIAHQVLCSAGHNTPPNFVRQYFLRADDPLTEDFFYASM
jgi:hypothetical protein